MPAIADKVYIAQTLYRAGDIETYGTGLHRIKDACDAQVVKR